MWLRSVIRNSALTIPDIDGVPGKWQPLFFMLDRDSSAEPSQHRLEALLLHPLYTQTLSSERFGHLPEVMLLKVGKCCPQGTFGNVGRYFVVVTLGTRDIVKCFLTHSTAPLNKKSISLKCQ